MRLYSAQPHPRIAIAPDSFKGTLTAQQAAAALALGLQQVIPNATILQWPLADGGEGTLVTLQSIWGGESQYWPVQNAVGMHLHAPMYCCEIESRSAAVIEVAQVVGITDAKAMHYPVAQRTTLGVGQLMQYALAQGIRQFYVGLGGSCTNDGGAGLLVGLGAVLRDAQGQPLSATPEGLAQLAQVDLSVLNPALKDSQIVVLSDVNSPLCGADGATQTFGPQKGLGNAAERDRIDQALAHFAILAEQAMTQYAPHRNTLGIHTLPGAGAAGGLGFALQLLGGAYVSGARFIAELLDLPHHLTQVDWLITGEGRSDRQTLQGKAPWIVAQMAQAQGVPVTLLSGAIALEDRVSLDHAFGHQCFSLAPGPVCCFPVAEAPQDLDDCCTHAFDWLIKAGIHLGHQWQAQQPHSC